MDNKAAVGGYPRSETRLLGRKQHQTKDRQSNLTPLFICSRSSGDFVDDPPDHQCLKEHRHELGIDVIAHPSASLELPYHLGLFPSEIVLCSGHASSEALTALSCTESCNSLESVVASTVVQRLRNQRLRTLPETLGTVRIKKSTNLIDRLLCRSYVPMNDCLFHQIRDV